jgi:hypothetical protein
MLLKLGTLSVLPDEARCTPCSSTSLTRTLMRALSPPRSNRLPNLHQSAQFHRS